VIETHHLSKLYSRGLYALQDLSLTVDKGEFVFLTGPSGAGKSTLLRLLLVQDRPTEGDLFVNGHDLTTLSRSDIQEYRRGIGFIFQDFKLIPTRTVFENIAFVLEVLGVPAGQQRRRAFQVLKWVGLQHRINAYPRDLSGGEQQRIAIARALVNDPALVLADEPTGNLDGANAASVFALMLELNRERATSLVVVTHDLKLAQRMERIYELERGTLIARS
jgi:cell division transport system ATP-binding protein